MKNTVVKPNEHDKGFRRIVLRVLNARISVPSWMLGLSSALLSWAVLFFMVFNPAEVAPLVAALPFSGWIWVPFLVLGTTATIYGMMRYKALPWLKFGSFLSFIMWIFGGVAFWASGSALTFWVVVLPWMIFYAYTYLAAHFRDEIGL